jgi:hypothetical protein
MKSFLIFIFFLVSFKAFSQRNLQDVVYLKNGDVVRGVIIEQIPNISLKIQTKDKSIFNYNFSEIEKITKENFPSRFLTRKTKSISLLELGYQTGFGSDFDWGIRENRWKLDYSYLFNLRPNLSLGLRAGLRYYIDNGLIIPICGTIRGDFSFRNMKPFYSISAGYSFSELTDPEGFLFNPNIGTRFEVNPSFDLTLGLGYELQLFSTYTSGYYNNFSSYAPYYYANAICVNVGVIF